MSFDCVSSTEQGTLHSGFLQRGEDSTLVPQLGRHFYILLLLFECFFHGTFLSEWYDDCVAPIIKLEFSMEFIKV